MALAATVAAALLTVGRVGRVYGEKALDPRQAITGTMRALRSSFAANLLLLLLPLGILLCNAFFVRNCAPWEGIAFFLLLPGVTACVATALAFFCTVHYRHPRTLYVLYVLATLAYAAALGYLTPAIFSYNFFYGYFPGLTWDEGLRLSSVLVSFRLVSLAVAALLLWLGVLLLHLVDRDQPARRKGVLLLRALLAPGQRGLTAMAVIILGGLYFFRCDLGYESTSAYIRQQLGGMLKTRHCVIYYPRGFYTPADLSRVADEHEFRFHQLAELFGITQPQPVESYIYPSADAKLRLIGAGTTDFAKPWSRQVHITAQSLMSTLKHELVHVMAARFGRPVLRASFSMGLTEGLAMAVEWDWGARSLHQYAAAMRELDLAPDIRALMTPAGFMTQSSQVSYVLAGSFCRYLIDRYGIQRLLLLYGSEDYRRYYSRPLRALIAEWEDFLDGMELDDTDLAAAEVFFRQPSIFRKTCPRVVGERDRRAARALGAGNYAAAESLYAVSYEEGHGYDALSGRVTAALRRGQYDTVITVLDHAVAADPHPQRFLALSLQRGDASWGLGDQTDASRSYEALRTVDLADAYTEAAGVRLAALADSMFQTDYRRYFLFAGPDSVRTRLLDSLDAIAPPHPLVRYLRGRAAMRAGNFPEAITLLSGISMAATDPVLEAIRLASLGIAAYQTGDYAGARTDFWLSLNYDDSEAAEHGAYDWIERCEWKMNSPESTP